MAISHHIKPLFTLILFLIPILSLAQTNNYTFTCPELIPDLRIKDLLNANLNLCFDNTDINTHNMQQHIHFYVQNDSLMINLVTSPKVITDTQVDWGLLNIKGVFEHKGKLVIVQTDEGATKEFELFFRKKSTHIKSTIELDVYGEPSCSTI